VNKIEEEKIKQKIPQSARILQVREKAKILREKIGMHTFPVGVKFILQRNVAIIDEVAKIEDVKRLNRHRYCQAVMEARHGKHVLLDKEGIACPAAAAAFGFKPLPEGLKNGKGLVGFGITEHIDVGREMFKEMPSLAMGELNSLYLFPLETAIIEPDVVVMEDQVERLMWVVLAYINVKGGKRVESSTAVLQATCVDSTIIPYKQHRMNLSYGCYGCRDATDIGPDESVLGFPYSDFDKIVEYIEHLSMKAIPNSRSKNAYTVLKKRSAEKVLRTDIFQMHQKEK